MRKRIIDHHPRNVGAEESDWLDLERLALVEVASEDVGYPIENESQTCFCQRGKSITWARVRPAWLSGGRQFSFSGRPWLGRVYQRELWGSARRVGAALTFSTTASNFLARKTLLCFQNGQIEVGAALVGNELVSLFGQVAEGHGPRRGQQFRHLPGGDQGSQGIRVIIAAVKL